VPSDGDRRGLIRIGISGWSYKPWRRVFYPEGLRQKDELGYASRQFASIEINGTFYSLQRPTSFSSWAAAAPNDFVYAIKGPRYITHILRLRDAGTALANFFASGLLNLGRKLGPILWQLPPNFSFDAERLEAFLELLPRTTAAAARLAQSHEPRMDGRMALEPVADTLIRHALEVRHESFRSRAFIELLRREKSAVSWRIRYRGHVSPT
jgi:uncharacterized protein YecE (DUF72 family)